MSDLLVYILATVEFNMWHFSWLGSTKIQPQTATF